MLYCLLQVQLLQVTPIPAGTLNLSAVKMASECTNWALNAEKRLDLQFLV